MLALKEASGRAEEEVTPSASSTRASSPLTQASSGPDVKPETPAVKPETPAVKPETPAVKQENRPPQAGDVVDGRYVLIEPLGKGGMGVVWKARSTALDVEVAVKLVRSSPTPSADAFKRMAREAHAAARLGHPAMATVLDFGATPTGDPYVVMELLHGESLGDVLGRERRIDPVRAVTTLLPLLDGLREAHDKGIVHRDIKPENLFLAKTSRGRLQPKVLDFGIAKLELSDDTQTRLTQDGAVLGSPGYFSPEQARGETDIDLRTDIWSICVVLYELVTGELPFSGPNYNALLMSILKESPKPLMAHGYGDDALWRIVQRGLVRDRNKRWSSMWELGRALAGWLRDRGVTVDVTSRSLQEVWLDPRSASEQAPSPLAFGTEGARRRVLSTIKHRVADTLAGETISTLILHHRVPTKILGLGAAAVVSLAAIFWSLLGHDGTASHAAAPAAGRELAAPAPTAEPMLAPAEVLSTADATRGAPAMRTSASGSPAAPFGTNRTVEKRAPSSPIRPTASRARATDSAPKAASVVAPGAKTRPTSTPTRKRIDQEFGF
jgi:eukaryotic-like serine/threonine-protein kinase